jgi:hypothetical protein
MEEDIRFSKMTKRFLECHDGLSALYKSFLSFSENKSQVSLDEFTSNIKKLDSSMEALRNTLQLSIKDALDIETDEVDVIETDNGYKL